MEFSGDGGADFSEPDGKEGGDGEDGCGEGQEFSRRGGSVESERERTRDEQRENADLIKVGEAEVGGLQQVGHFPWNSQCDTACETGARQCGVPCGGNE